MKTEHKYAQVLRWIADGESVEARRTGFNKEQPWADFPHDFDERLVCIALLGDDQWEFRLKPRTITVNGREIVAPIHHQDEGQEVWSFDVLGNVFRTTYRSGKSMSYAAAEFGAIFASEHDAECARDEISKLLKSAW